jgi:hypothetical protein
MEEADDFRCECRLPEDRITEALGIRQLVDSMRRLLNTTELNLDDMEEETMEAVAEARELLEGRRLVDGWRGGPTAHPQDSRGA